MKKILSNLLVKYFVKKAVVLSNEKIGESFQLLTIKLPDKKEWIPGQKIQIKVSESELRSYTPSFWENDRRTFQTLIYNHRSGPGAQWSETVLPQTKVQVVGPRKSLDITTFKKNIFFFGDETTYGLAHALINSNRGHSLKCFFEGSLLNEAMAALKYLRLDDQLFFERTSTDSHLNACLEKILSDYKDEVIILSGKMSSMTFLEKGLLEYGLSKELIVKKRYWGWKKPNLAV